MIPFIRRKSSDTRSPMSERIHNLMCAPKRVLIVDDDEHVRAFVETVLARDFHVDLVQADSAETAERWLAGQRFDVVILDVRLSTRDGVELYRDLVLPPGVEVVFLTGYDNDDLRDRVAAIGPARVFSKARAIERAFLVRLFTALGVRRKTVAPAESASPFGVPIQS